MKLFKRLLLSLCLSLPLFGQVPCTIAGSFTATGNSIQLDNRRLGCYQWKFVYTNVGFSGISISVQEAPDNGGVPGSWANFSGASVVVIGSNPTTSTNAGLIGIQSAAAWVRVNLGTATGSGTVIYQLWGANSTSSSSVPSSSSAPSGPAGGDLSGTYPNPAVIATNGGAIPASAGVAGTNSMGQFIASTSANVIGLWGGTCNSGTFLNGAGNCATPSGAPSGAAGGDLSGTYPNPGVAQVNGAIVPASMTQPATNASSQFVALAPNTGIPVTSFGGILGGFLNSTSVPQTGIWPSTATSSSFAHYPVSMYIYNPMISMVTNNVQGALYQLNWRQFDESVGAGEDMGPYGVIAIPPLAIAGVYSAGSSYLSGPQWAAESVAVGMRLGGSINCVGGTCAQFGGFAWEAVNTNVQPFFWLNGGGSVAGSATVYGGPSQQNNTTQTTENNVAVYMPAAGTIKDLCLSGASGTTPGTFTDTLRVNGVDTAVTFQLASSTSVNGGWFCDHTHSASVSAGQYVTIKYVNGSGSATPTWNSSSFTFTPSGAATAIIIFPNSATTIGAVTTEWLSPYFGSWNTSLVSESNARGPMPRAGTMKNLYCAYTAPPSASNTVTLMKNGSSQTLTVTVPSGGSGLQNVSDTTHSVSFVAGDAFDLQVVAASGTFATYASCSAEFD